MKREMSFIKGQVTSQQTRSMRNNLLVHGLCEEKNEDCENKIRSFLKLNLDYHKEVDIERCHRLGPYKKDKTRPIVTKFLRFPDKEEIKKSSHKLRGQPLYLSDQFPKEIQEKRKILRKIEKSLKENKEDCFLSVDRLYTDGFVYVVEEGITKKFPSTRKVFPSRHREQTNQTQRPYIGPKSSLTKPPTLDKPVSIAMEEAHQVLNG